MADMLRAGQEWLANQLKTHASSTVVYLRGLNQTSVMAIIGRTLMKLEDGYGGVHMQWIDRDFLSAPEHWPASLRAIVEVPLGCSKELEQSVAPR